MSDPASLNHSHDNQNAGNRYRQLLSVSPWVMVSLVLLVTFLAYAGTLWFKFVYDDRGQILANMQVHYWRFAPHYFSERVWSFAYPGIPGNYYRPLFLLYLLLNYKIFGPFPAGWHLMSVFTQVGVTYFVYLLVRRLTRDFKTALVASLIFGLDPVHIESVAWISGVTDPLAALFLLPSFLCYLNWRDRIRHRWMWLGGSLILYGLAMLSKETALILPFIILAFEWLWQESSDNDAWLRRAFQRTWASAVRTVPFVLLTFGYLAARWHVIKGLGHDMVPLSISTIVFTWPQLLVFYIRHLVWPFNLSVFYDVPYIKTPGLWSFYLPAVVIVALGLLFWLLLLRLGKTSPSDNRMVAFACAWVLIPFIPLLDLSVLPVGEIAHDRYLYLPSLGFAMLAAMGLRRIRLGKRSLFGVPALQAVAVICLALIFGISTPLQDRYWANDTALYGRGVEMTPYNKLARTNLGNAMGEQGHYAQAIALYRQVLVQDPHFWLAVYNMGYTYYRVGNLQGAQEYLERAIAINGVDSDEYFYLGLTWLKLGHVNDAERAVRHAIKLHPEGLAYHFAMGMILKLKGNLSGAMSEFKQELENFPGEAGAEQQIQSLRIEMTHARKKS